MPADLERAAGAAGYFHLEIFQALAGMRDSLMRERAMENDFLARTGKPVNFIFRKVTGAAWDAFTIGFYRDLRPYVCLCRYPDCTHTHEADCAIKDAFADGVSAPVGTDRPFISLARMASMLAGQKSMRVTSWPWWCSQPPV